VAEGYYDLANVVYQQQVQIETEPEDLVKAEALMRESLRIRTRLYDSNHRYIGNTVGLLASILKAQGQLGHETKELLERALAIVTKHYGPDGINTAISIASLVVFYLLYFSVLLYMLYIPSHEYFFLIDSILYLYRSGWFVISMEIDFVTHMEFLL
jgi:hypothetical protein